MKNFFSKRKVYSNLNLLYISLLVTVGQSVQQTFNVGNGFQVSGLLNGGILDATQVQQQGVVQNNLVPLGQL